MNLLKSIYDNIKRAISYLRKPYNMYVVFAIEKDEMASGIIAGKEVVRYKVNRVPFETKFLMGYPKDVLFIDGNEDLAIINEKADCFYNVGRNLAFYRICKVYRINHRWEFLKSDLQKNIEFWEEHTQAIINNWQATMSKRG